MDDNERTSGSANGENGSKGGGAKGAPRGETRRQGEQAHHERGGAAHARRHAEAGGGARLVSRSAREQLETESDDEDDLRSTEEGLMAIRDALEEQVRERPLVTLACAVGVGVVLGQALSSRIGRVALLAAGGYAATRFVRSDGMSMLSGLLGEDVDDDDPDEENAATRDVHA